MNKKLFIMGVLSLLPVWRSGGRTHLNYWEFILNHTIYGPPIEYVPEENYRSALGISRRG